MLSPALSGAAASGTTEALTKAEFWREDVAIHILAYRLTWWETVLACRSHALIEESGHHIKEMWDNEQTAQHLGR